MTPDKGDKLEFKGTITGYRVGNNNVEDPENVKHLGILEIKKISREVEKGLEWFVHFQAKRSS